MNRSAVYNKVEILIDSERLGHFEIRDQERIYFVGALWAQGQWWTGKEACQKISEFFADSSATEFKEKLKTIQGHFSFILDSPRLTIAAVDKIRSFPVFYSSRPEQIVLSNSARLLKKKLSLGEQDPLSLLEFEMAGYVTGSETLVKGLEQLEAGQCLWLDKISGQLHIDDYYLYLSTRFSSASEDQLSEELHEINKRLFKRLIASLNGKQVWLPLSGGLDSRFILTLLLELKYDNIVTFSYGKPGHPEIVRASIIAKKLKVKWLPVYYPINEVKFYYQLPERKTYFDYADGLSSVPCLNDYYALLMLQRQNKLPENVVIINGQSGDFITGGHIPRNVVLAQSHPLEFLLKEIINKHFSLWENLKTPENLEKISEKIIKKLGLNPQGKYSPQEIAQYFELWEWRERQTKFVINQVRIYEWFGCEWRLPLWDDELMAFWEKIPLDMKLGQKLYKYYLNTKNLGKVFNGFYMGPHPLQKWEWLAINILIPYAKIMREDPQRLIHKYLDYFTNYAPFYIQKSYQEYLQDSYWHRNPFSYLVKDYLKANHSENLSASL